MKYLQIILLLLLNVLHSKIIVPENYPDIIEQLVYFKDDRFKVFYGGPIDNGTGVKWLTPVLFEDEDHRVRAVYEISFINCLPNPIDAHEADIFYLKISDIDIKFKNELCEEYLVFSKIINNQDENKKCILIREVDVSNIYYPEIFIEAVYSEFKQSDKECILLFLQTKYKTKTYIKDLAKRAPYCQKRMQESDEGLIEQRKVSTRIDEIPCDFYVDHYYLHNDPWKSYYIVTDASLDKHDASKEENIMLRIDSGCNSGQIYNDQACDCLEQLYQGLANITHSKNRKSLLIHIPGHDGRGFGVAPKAETEIYKRGGVGRVHQTESLDTIQAAVLLYQTTNYDIRSYDGCAKILKLNKIANVDLLTDNKNKVKALHEYGLTVNRKRTHTQKETCIHHIRAKMRTNNYFQN
jgi:GTP cyclohydrolase II